MPVVIHTKVGCPYCSSAIALLEEKVKRFREVTYDPQDSSYDSRKQRLIAQTKHQTFPQIFVNAKFIGGYTELLALVHTKKIHVSS